MIWAYKNCRKNIGSVSKNRETRTMEIDKKQ